MAWTRADIPDLSGTVAVVTGATNGLGLESTSALAGAGAHVVLAARTMEKARAAQEGVRHDHPEASLEVVQLDLASLDSVRAAAARIREAHPRVDLLLNNAGLMAVPQQRTEDGFEMQLGVNHLGHWTLTARLLPALLAASAARVVTVTSTAHHMGRPVDPDDPHLDRGYSPWQAYGQSKLANYHFGLGLQRAFEAHGVRATSLLAHPGLSVTGLQTRTKEEGALGPAGARVEEMTARLGMSAADGALPQLRAATDPAARGGQMYGPRYVNTGPPVRRPILRRVGLDSAIRTLGEVSERLTGEPIDVGAALREARS